MGNRGAGPGLLGSVDDLWSSGDYYGLLCDCHGHILRHFTSGCLGLIVGVDTHVTLDGESASLNGVGLCRGVGSLERTGEGLAVDLGGGVRVGLISRRGLGWGLVITSLFVLNGSLGGVSVSTLVEVRLGLGGGDGVVERGRALLVVLSLNDIVGSVHLPLPQVAVHLAAVWHAPPGLNVVIVGHQVAEGDGGRVCDNHRAGGAGPGGGSLGGGLEVTASGCGATPALGVGSDSGGSEKRCKESLHNVK